MITNLKQYRLIKIIAITLSVLLVWQSVSWANPDVFKKATLQPQLMMDRGSLEEASVRLLSSYLSKQFSKYETVLENRNVASIEECVMKVLDEIYKSGDMPQELFENTPTVITEDEKKEVLLDLGSLLIRYYNPKVASENPGDGYLVREGSSRKIGEYLSRQIVIRTEFTEAKEKQRKKELEYYDPEFAIDCLRQLDFRGDDPKEAVRIHSEFMEWFESLSDDVTPQKGSAIMKRDYIKANLKWIFAMSSEWDPAETIIKGRKYEELSREERDKVKVIATKTLKAHTGFTSDPDWTRQIGKEHAVNARILEALEYVREFRDGPKREEKTKDEAKDIIPEETDKPSRSSEEKEEEKSEKKEEEEKQKKKDKKTFIQTIKSAIDYKRLAISMLAAAALSGILYLILPVNSFTTTVGFVVPITLFIFLIAKNFSWKNLVTAITISFILSIFLPLPWVGLSFAIIILSQIGMNRLRGMKGTAGKGTQAQRVAGSGENSNVKISNDILDPMYRLLEMRYGEADEEEATDLNTQNVLDAFFNVSPGSLKPDTEKIKKEIKRFVIRALEAIKNGYNFDLLNAIRILEEAENRPIDEVVSALNELSQEISHQVVLDVPPKKEGNYIMAVQEVILDYFEIDKKTQERLLVRQVMVILRERISESETIGVAQAEDYYTLGRLEFHFGDIKESERNFEKAAQANKANTDYLLTLGILKHYLKKWKEAENKYKLYLAIVLPEEKKLDEEGEAKLELVRLLLKKASKRVALDGSKEAPRYSSLGELTPFRYSPFVGAPVFEELFKVGIPLALLGILNEVNANLPGLNKGIFVGALIILGGIFVIAHVLKRRGPPDEKNIVKRIIATYKILTLKEKLLTLTAPFIAAVSGIVISVIYIENPPEAILASIGVHFLINIGVFLLRRILGIKMGYASQRKAAGKVSSSEIECTYKGLDLVFEGGQKTGGKIINALPDPYKYKKDTKTISRKGIKVTFYKKKVLGYRRHAKWVFKEEDIQKVQKMFDLTLRENLKQMPDDEISLGSAEECQKIFMGSTKEIRREIVKRLPNAKKFKGEKRIVTAEGISVTFYRRRRGSRKVWAFKKKDTKEVAIVLGLRLSDGVSPVGEDELRCSYRTFLEIFLTETKAARAKIKDIFPDAEETTKKTIVLGKGENKVTFYKRRSSGHRVWVFKKKDLYKVAKLVGLDARDDPTAPKADEIVFSARILSEYVIGVPVDTQRARDKKLPKASKFEKNQKTISENGVTVVFYKRKHNRHSVWAFKKSDLEDVAKIFDFKLRRGAKILQKGETALHGDILVKFFQETIKEIDEVIEEKLPDPAECEDANIKRGSKKNKVVFFKRIVGGQLKWAVKNEDVSKLSKILGLTWGRIRKLDNTKEIAFTRKGTNGIFVNETEVRAKRDEKLPKFNEVTGFQKTIRKGDIEVTFFKRKNVAERVWAFRKEDTWKVAVIFGLRIKKIPTDEEILNVVKAFSPNLKKIAEVLHVKGSIWDFFAERKMQKVILSILAGEDTSQDKHPSAGYSSLGDIDMMPSYSPFIGAPVFEELFKVGIPFALLRALNEVNAGLPGLNKGIFIGALIILGGIFTIVHVLKRRGPPVEKNIIRRITSTYKSLSLKEKIHLLTAPSIVTLAGIAVSLVFPSQFRQAILLSSLLHLLVNITVFLIRKLTNIDLDYASASSKGNSSEWDFQIDEHPIIPSSSSLTIKDCLKVMESAREDLAQEIITNHDKLIKDINKATGSRLKKNSLKKEVRIKYLSNGKRKIVLKVTFITKKGKELDIALITSRKGKEKWITDTSEIPDLKKLKGRGVPIFGGQTEHNGNVWLIMGIIKGRMVKTAMENKELTGDMRGEIVKTLLTIAGVLGGKVPASIHGNNMMVTEDGKIVVVDIGNRRYDINTLEGKANFMIRVLRQYGWVTSYPKRKDGNYFNEIFDAVIDVLGFEGGIKFLEEAADYMESGSEEKLYKNLKGRKDENKAEKIKLFADEIKKYIERRKDENGEEDDWKECKDAQKIREKVRTQRKAYLSDAMKVTRLPKNIIMDILKEIGAETDLLQSDEKVIDKEIKKFSSLSNDERRNIVLQLAGHTKKHPWKLSKNDFIKGMPSEDEDSGFMSLVGLYEYYKSNKKASCSTVEFMLASLGILGEQTYDRSEAVSPSSWERLEKVVDILGVERVYVDLDETLFWSQGWIGGEEWISIRRKEVGMKVTMDELHEHEDRGKDSGHISFTDPAAPEVIARLQQKGVEVFGFTARAGRPKMRKRVDRIFKKLNELSELSKKPPVNIDVIYVGNTKAAAKVKRLITEQAKRDKKKALFVDNEHDKPLAAEEANISDLKVAFYKDNRHENWRNPSWYLSEAAKYIRSDEYDIAREGIINALELSSRLEGISETKRIELYTAAAVYINTLVTKSDIDLSPVFKSYLRNVGDLLYKIEKKGKPDPETVEFSKLINLLESFFKFYFPENWELMIEFYKKDLITIKRITDPSRGEEYAFDINRGNIYPYIEPILKKIMTEKPEKIFLLDSGARPMYWVIRAFINVMKKEGKLDEEIEVKVLPLSTKTSGDTLKSTRRWLDRGKEYKERGGKIDLKGEDLEAAKIFSELFPIEDKSIMLVDDNIVSGDSLDIAVRALAERGVKHITTGTICTFRDGKIKKNQVTSTFNVPGQYSWHRKFMPVGIKPDWENDLVLRGVKKRPRYTGIPIMTDMARGDYKFEIYDRFKKDLVKSFLRDLRDHLDEYEKKPPVEPIRKVYDREWPEIDIRERLEVYRKIPPVKPLLAGFPLAVGDRKLKFEPVDTVEKLEEYITRRNARTIDTYADHLLYKDLTLFRVKDENGNPIGVMEVICGYSHDYGRKAVIIDYLDLEFETGIDPEEFTDTVITHMAGITEQKGDSLLLLPRYEWCFSGHPKINGFSYYSERCDEAPVVRSAIYLKEAHELREGTILASKERAESIHRRLSIFLEGENFTDVDDDIKSEFKEGMDDYEEKDEMDTSWPYFMRYRFHSISRNKFKVLWGEAKGEKYKRYRERLKSCEEYIIDASEKKERRRLYLYLEYRLKPTRKLLQFLGQLEERKRFAEDEKYKFSPWQARFESRRKDFLTWDYRTKLAYQALEQYHYKLATNGGGRDQAYKWPNFFFEGKDGRERGEVILKYAMSNYFKILDLRNLKKILFYENKMQKLLKVAFNLDLLAVAEVLFPGQYDIDERGRQLLPKPIEDDDVIRYLEGSFVIVPGRARSYKISESGGRKGVQLEGKDDSRKFLSIPEEHAEEADKVVLATFLDKNLGLMLGMFTPESYRRWLRGDKKNPPFKVYLLSAHTKKPEEADPFILDLVSMRMGKSIRVRTEEPSWAYKETAVKVTPKKAFIEFEAPNFGIKPFTLEIPIEKTKDFNIKDGDKVRVGIIRDMNHGLKVQVFRAEDYDPNSPVLSENPLVTYAWLGGGSGECKEIDMALLDIINCSEGRKDFSKKGYERSIKGKAKVRKDGSAVLKVGIKLHGKEWKSVEFDFTPSEVEKYKLKSEPVVLKLKHDDYYGPYISQSVKIDGRGRLIRTNMYLDGNIRIDLGRMAIVDHALGNITLNDTRIYRHEEEVTEEGIIRIVTENGKSTEIDISRTPEFKSLIGKKLILVSEPTHYNGRHTYLISVYDLEEYEKNPRRGPDLMLARDDQRKVLVPLKNWKDKVITKKQKEEFKRGMDLLLQEDPDFRNILASMEGWLIIEWIKNEFPEFNEDTLRILLGRWLAGFPMEQFRRPPDDSPRIDWPEDFITAGHAKEIERREEEKKRRKEERKKREEERKRREEEIKRREEEREKEEEEDKKRKEKRKKVTRDLSGNRRDETYEGKRAELLEIKLKKDKYEAVALYGEEYLKRLEDYANEQTNPAKREAYLKVVEYYREVLAFDLPGIKKEVMTQNGLSPVHLYEREGVYLAILRNASLLADDCGIGKTVQALAFAIKTEEVERFDLTSRDGERVIIEANPNKPYVNKGIVVAGKSGLSQWMQQAQIWLEEDHDMIEIKSGGGKAVIYSSKTGEVRGRIRNAEELAKKFDEYDENPSGEVPFILVSYGTLRGSLDDLRKYTLNKILPKLIPDFAEFKRRFGDYDWSEGYLPPEIADNLLQYKKFAEPDGEDISSADLLNELEKSLFEGRLAEKDPKHRNYLKDVYGELKDLLCDVALSSEGYKTSHHSYEWDAERVADEIEKILSEYLSQEEIEAIKDRDEINYTVRRYYGTYDTLRKAKGRVTIVDEAHVMRKGESQQSQAIENFNENTWKLLLTATPIMGLNPGELYPELHWLFPDDEERPQFSSSSEFWKAYKGAKRSFKSQMKLHGDLMEVTTRRTKEEVLKGRLPEISETGPDRVIEVDLRVQDQIEYDLILRYFALFLRDVQQATEAEETIFKDHLFNALRILRFYTSGLRPKGWRGAVNFREQNDDKSMVFDPGNPKVVALDKIVDERISAGEKIVIFSTSLVVNKALAKRYFEEKGYNVCYIDATKSEINGEDSYEGEKLDRATLIKKFKEEPSLNIFISTYKTGGESIELCPANNVVLYDYDWDYPKQPKDRVHRQGQDRNVTVNVFRLQARDTIDEMLRILQEDKKMLYDAIIGGALTEEQSREVYFEFFRNVAREMFNEENRPAPQESDIVIEELPVGYYDTIFLETPTIDEIDVVNELFQLNLSPEAISLGGDYLKRLIIKSQNSKKTGNYIRIVRVDGEIAGYIYAHDDEFRELPSEEDLEDVPSGKRLYAMFVGVFEEFRGKSLAAAMLLKLCEEAFNDGYKQIVLTPARMKGVIDILGFRERPKTDPNQVSDFILNDDYFWQHYDEIVARLEGEREKNESPQIGDKAKVASIEYREEDAISAKIKDSKGEIHTIDLEHQKAFDVSNLKGVIQFTHSIDDAHKEVMLSVLSLLEKSPPALYTYSTLVEDLFGFARPENNMIAIHESLTTDTPSVIALIHEIMEYLVRTKKIKLMFENENITVLINENPVPQIIKLTRKDAIKQAEKDPFNPHYLLRALQREVFRDFDKDLTRLIKEKGLLEILKRNTNPLNRRHVERILEIFDILWWEGRERTDENEYYAEVARKLAIIQAVDGSYGTSRMLDRPQEFPLKVLEERGITIDKDSELGLLLYDDVFRKKDGTLKAIEGSALPEDKKKLLKEMYVYFCVSDSIDIGSDYLKKVEVRSVKGDKPRDYESPKESYEFQKSDFRKSWGVEIEDDFIAPETRKVLEAADENEKPDGVEESTLEKAQRLVEITKEAWTPTHLFDSQEKSLDLFRDPYNNTRYELTDEARSKALEEIKKRIISDNTIDKLVHDLITLCASRKGKEGKSDDEKMLLAIDLELGSMDVENLFDKLSKVLPHNNKELEVFLDNLRIVGGKGESLARRVKDLSTLSESGKGKIDPDNIIVLTTSTGISNYEALEGISTIAGVDNTNFSEEAYFPLIEIMLFTIGKHLGWSEEVLRNRYALIPNAFALSDLDESDIKAALGKNIRTFIVRLIPDAVPFDEFERQELMETIHTVLAQA